MGKACLLDTNAISKGVLGLFPENGLSFFRGIVSKEVNFSVITRIELLGFNPNDSQIEHAFRQFVLQGNEYPIDEPVIIKTIELRKRIKIKLPDALIAATAIVHRLTLVSDNDSDFLRVPKLKYINPAHL